MRFLLERRSILAGIGAVVALGLFESAGARTCRLGALDTASVRPLLLAARGESLVAAGGDRLSLRRLGRGTFPERAVLSVEGIEAIAVDATRVAVLSGERVVVHPLDPSSATDSYHVSVPAGSGAAALAMDRGVLVLARGGVITVHHVGDERSTLHQTISGAPGERLGAAVAIRGPTLAAGAPGAGGKRGAVVIFRSNGLEWVEDARFPAPVGSAAFGSALALDGDDDLVLLVGGARPAGVAHAFERRGGAWREAGTLHAGRGDDEADVSTTRVVIDGELAVVFAGSDARAFRRGSGGWHDEGPLGVGPTADVAIVSPYALVAGGDEVVIHAISGDCDGNDVADLCDIHSGAQADVDGNHVPDDCELSALGELQNRGGRVGDGFGYSVALSGSLGVVGAVGDAHAGKKSGAAHVHRFDGSGFSRVTRLVARDASSEDLFGVSVAATPDAVIVGAALDDDNGAESGAVYVFDTQRFVQRQKLLAGDGDADDRFGASVAAAGDLLLVGADADEDAGPSSGSVYAFRFGGTMFFETEKIVARSVGAEDRFGTSVAVDGDLAVVGAPGHTGAGRGSGAAFAFRFDGARWIEEALLRGADTGPGDELGSAVAIHGNVAVVGARRHGGPGRRSGAAYVFTRENGRWSPTWKLLPPSAKPGDAFGSSVAATAHAIVVGCNGREGGIRGRGAAFLFRHGDARVTRAVLTSPTIAAEGERLGSAVAADGPFVLVGGHAQNIRRPGRVLAYGIRALSPLP